MEKKKKTYEITRIVVETYYVDATSPKEAKAIIADRGDPSKVTVRSEIARQIPF